MQGMPLEQMQFPQAHREISRRSESTARISPFRREKVRTCMGCELEVLNAIGELDGSHFYFIIAWMFQSIGVS
jgi:hypothetical protein